MKMDPIRIHRPLANGLVMEIQLTEDEVYRVYEHYEHHCDVNYTCGELAQRECEALEPLTEKQWMDAVRNIAWEKRRQQDKYGYDEEYALDEALKWYIKTVLSEMPKHFFEIELGNADDNNVVECVDRIYCWAYDLPTTHAAAIFCRDLLERDFEEVMAVTEIAEHEIGDYLDTTSDWMPFEFLDHKEEE